MAQQIISTFQIYVSRTLHIETRAEVTVWTLSSLSRLLWLPGEPTTLLLSVPKVTFRRTRRNCYALRVIILPKPVSRVAQSV
jgi:hypothetical protein